MLQKYENFLNDTKEVAEFRSGRQIHPHNTSWGMNEKSVFSRHLDEEVLRDKTTS